MKSTKQHILNEEVATRKQAHQIANKVDSRIMAESIGKGGQLLLPPLELVWNTEQTVEDLKYIFAVFGQG